MTRKLLLIFILLHAHICLAEQLFIKRDNGSLKIPHNRSNIDKQLHWQHNLQINTNFMTLILEIIKFWFTDNLNILRSKLANIKYYYCQRKKKALQYLIPKHMCGKYFMMGTYPLTHQCLHCPTKYRQHLWLIWIISIILFHSQHMCMHNGHGNKMWARFWGEEEEGREALSAVRVTGEGARWEHWQAVWV